MFNLYRLTISDLIIWYIAFLLLQSDQFQPDIYPDTASPTPAMSAEEWFSGTTRGPVLMSMKTGKSYIYPNPILH